MENTGKVRPIGLGTGAALSAAILLVAGATWHGFAADSPVSAAQATTQTTPTISRAVAGGRDSYADVVKVVAPSVVTIRTEGKARVSPTGFGNDDDLFRRFFGDQPGRSPRVPRAFRQRGLGSGVVVTPDGYILTNDHVIDDADDIRVEFSDGRTFKAKLVGSDKPSDLALLHIDAANLQPLALGNSDVVQVGDVVLAVGNPLGVGQTVTMGIVSAKGRSTGAGDGYEDFLQTDAPINHGNSGGALVNTKGELVGINSQILSPSDGNIGIGFAIPANMARHVMDELRTGGRVRRAQLGVTVQPVTADMAESLGLPQSGGVIVSSVASGSAADHAGAKRGDIIKSFNGQGVQDTNSLRNRVADTPPGSNATLVILRDGSERTLTATLDESSASQNLRANDSRGPEDKAALGIAATPLTPELAARAGLPRDTHGVLVQQVNPDGRAAAAGIQPGDVILEVNRQPVQSIDELRAGARRSMDRPVLLLISRDGKELFTTVKPS
jgi:Do/DeqQ family serine protease